MKVHEAITEVMKSVGAVGKSDKHDFHRFNFRGIDTTLNALSPAFREHGVTVRPSGILSCTYEAFTTSKGAQSMACRLIVEFTISGPEGDEITAVVAGEAADTGDKATPKAMSVAFRTALLQTFALPTQEVDPDAHSYVRQQGPAKDWLELAGKAETKDQIRVVWNEAKAAGAPQPMLDRIVQMGQEKAA